MDQKKIPKSNTDLRIAPSFLDPQIPRAYLQAGLLALPVLRLAFPSLFCRDSDFSPLGLPGKRFPYPCKGRNHSGGTAPDSDGIPY